MSTNYNHNNSLVESLALRSNKKVKQVIGSSNIFQLSTYGFDTEEDNIEFSKYNVYNGETWGQLASLEYYNNGTPVPFIDKNTIPLPYLVLQEDITNPYLRQLPNHSIVHDDETQHILYISAEELIGTFQIEYNANDCITIYKNGSQYSSPIPAASAILVDAQAPGGSGGGSAVAMDNIWFTNCYAMGGGGGGGSGGFATIAADLKKNNLTIQHASANSYIDIISSLSNNQSLRINPGEDGKVGDARIGVKTSGLTQAPEYYGSGGDGGAGGTVSIVSNTTSGIVAAAPTSYLMTDGLYVIDSVAGTNGSNGAYSTTGTAKNSNTTAGGSFLAKYIKLSSIDSCTAKTTYFNSTQGTSGGKGEQSASVDYFCGGGGGGASLASNGASHSNFVSSGGSYDTYTPGIGAGCFGQSAWGTSKTSLQAEVKRDKHGLGAMWLYYIPDMSRMYDMYFTLNDSGELIPKDKTYLPKFLVIPNQTSDGQAITKIAANAFNGCTNFTEVSIMPGITRIKEQAFANNSNLKTIYVPTGLIMETNIFKSCSNLTIYCKEAKKPYGWNITWNPDNQPVIWSANCKMYHRYGNQYVYIENCIDACYNAWDCEICGNTRYESITPYGSHDYEYVETIKPTYTTGGYERWKCYRCSARPEIRKNEIAATGYPITIQNWSSYDGDTYIQENGVATINLRTRGVPYIDGIPADVEVDGATKVEYNKKSTSLGVLTIANPTKEVTIICSTNLYS